MTTITHMREILQAYHEGVPGVVRSFLYPPRKIETAMMPCVMVRTGAGAWRQETTQTLRQTRTFFIECCVEALPQNLFETQERKIDELIQAFGEFYCLHKQIAPDAWLLYDQSRDNGWEDLNFGTRYVGFIFEIQVEMRNNYG
jgi:hypothetical protein